MAYLILDTWGRLLGKFTLPPKTQGPVLYPQLAPYRDPNKLLNLTKWFEGVANAVCNTRLGQPEEFDPKNVLPLQWQYHYWKLQGCINDDRYWWMKPGTKTYMFEYWREIEIRELEAVQAMEQAFVYAAIAANMAALIALAPEVFAVAGVAGASSNASAGPTILLFPSVGGSQAAAGSGVATGVAAGIGGAAILQD